MRRWTAPAVVAVVTSLATLLGTAPVAATPPGPAVRSGVTQPIFSYADAIRETVYVESSVDGDRDGRPDRIAADVIRPRATALGLRVPVIFESSPYYACCGRGNENEKKQAVTDGDPSFFPLYYDNYFVPRGYAVVLADLSGTRASEGCVDLGGPNEIQGAKAVVDWLNGRAPAYRNDGSAVTATWSTGRVGMIGKSWDAGTVNGVAATGVAGLRTIVPIGGPASWYDYHRDGGLPIQPPWPRPAQMFDQVNGRPAETCADSRAVLETAPDDATGNYNSFWAARDYLRNADRVRASVLLVHGLNDWNVDPEHVGAWWDALGRNAVPRKLWLSQVGHAEPFDFRREQWMSTLHRWFDFWLYGIPNRIMSEPVADIEHAPGQWSQHRSWPDRRATPVTVRLGSGAPDVSGVLTSGPVDAATRTFTDDPAQREAAMVENEQTVTPGRLAFLSPVLTRPVRISGTSYTRLTARVNDTDTNFAVKLVDYGTATRVVTGLVFDNGVPAWSEGLVTLDTESCWGASTPADEPCYRETAERTAATPYDIVTRGWLDAKNRESLLVESPLTPGQTYDFTVPLQVDDHVFPAGHRIGVVVAGSDPFWTRPDTNRAQVTLDLQSSSIRLPVVGGVASLGF
ncbi:Xaa-Pro dipeptidyl-peptidase [Micromonospora sp. DT201]|uniref:Xaa-Pro dipeptidyl-peptidase n=1 Tax=Micromonospora sp. DT201 TaxID=3393442 RepID=UPI003CF8C73D